MACMAANAATPGVRMRSAGVGGLSTVDDARPLFCPRAEADEVYGARVAAGVVSL